MDPQTALQIFEGRWRMARRIADAMGVDARFDGEAVFAARDGALHLAEAGQMQIGDQSFAATRRYLWRAGAGGMIDVFFEDGRYFHAFDPAQGRPQAHHDCPPDTYDVRYDLTGLRADAPQGTAEWTAEWRVTGPRKDYVMTTTYTRL